MTNQAHDTYVVHSENLHQYADVVKQWKEKFHHFLLQKIGRDNNTVLDNLAKITSDEVPNDEGVEVEVYASTIYNSTIHVIHSSADTWIDEIYKYIKHNILPEDPIKAK